MEKRAGGGPRGWTGGLAAALCGGFALLLYLRTLAPTVLYYDLPHLRDSATLQAKAAVLGIPDYTGYPTYVMLAHLFTYLPFGDVAYRVNLASAVFGAAAVGLLCLAGTKLCGRAAAGAAGALAFGVTPVFWSQAVVAEVYTLNALFVALVLCVLLAWRERRRDGYLLAAAFLMGLSLTHHLTSGLLLPAAALFVLLVEGRKLLEWRLLAKGAGLFALGLTPYLYLPIRASMDPPLDEWEPTSLGRFWYLVGGGDHQKLLWEFGPAELPGRFMLYLGYLFQNFHWGLVMVAMVGMAVLVARDRAAALLVGFLFSGWLFHALEYGIRDVNLYFITTYLMVALALAVGVAGLTEAVEDFLSRYSYAARTAVMVSAAMAAVLYPLIYLPAAYARNDMSDDYEGRRIIETVAEKAKPGATVLHHRSSLWYMVLVEKRRQDITLVDPWPPGRQRYTDIVWPDDINFVTANLRYGTNDYTGVTTAREAARTGPVYILDQDSAAPQNFWNADFNIVRVERGVLYELVPPGGKTYTPPREQKS